MVNHLITQFTCVIRRTETDIVVDPIHTRRVILTVIIFAVIWVYFTPLPLIAKGARTAESIFICLGEVAGPSILTWILNARINGHTAVPTLEAKRAGALIKLHWIIAACPIVLTWIGEAGVTLGHNADIYRLFALEVVGWCCEQQPVHHGFRPAAAGYSWLFVPCLHPLGKPAEVAVTV